MTSSLIEQRVNNGVLYGEATLLNAVKINEEEEIEFSQDTKNFVQTYTTSSGRDCMIFVCVQHSGDLTVTVSHYKNQLSTSGLKSCVDGITERSSEIPDLIKLESNGKVFIKWLFKTRHS